MVSWYVFGYIVFGVLLLGILLGQESGKYAERSRWTDLFLNASNRRKELYTSGKPLTSEVIDKWHLECFYKVEEQAIFVAKNGWAKINDHDNLRNS